MQAAKDDWLVFKIDPPNEAEKEILARYVAVNQFSPLDCMAWQLALIRCKELGLIRAEVPPPEPAPEVEEAPKPGTRKWEYADKQQYLDERMQERCQYLADLKNQGVDVPGIFEQALMQVEHAIGRSLPEDTQERLMRAWAQTDFQFNRQALLRVAQKLVPAVVLKGPSL